MFRYFLVIGTTIALLLATPAAAFCQFDQPIWHHVSDLLREPADPSNPYHDILVEV